MRLLSEQEIKKTELLTSLNVEVAYIEPTATGLNKSIMDATQSVRYFLSSNDLHDFALQKQGPDAKVIIEANILTVERAIHTTISLYRPTTKKGDPRIWISGINKYCKANDIIALIAYRGGIYAFNLTSNSLAQMQEGLLGEITKASGAYASNTADELLALIRGITSKGFIESEFRGDTAVGRLLEHELGIPINSSKSPDYKGIELKSFRSERKNRSNLFAQVPNWQISKFKSSLEILNNFGYYREEVHKLYCTVSSKNFNSQSLRLKVSSNTNRLIEYSSRQDVGDFVAWDMDTLRQRLTQKHNETFWVEADVKREGNKESFRFTKVEHTRRPIMSQLEVLLAQGEISLDHLIKAKGRTAVEKGPIFKLSHNSLGLLFPPSEKYIL